MEEGSNFFEWTHKRATGEEFPATVLLTRVEIENGKPFLQATVRDITEQKKTEETLKRETEFSVTILDSMTESVAIINVADFKIANANKAFLEQYGLTLEEVMGESCHELTHKSEKPCGPPNDTCPIPETLESGKYVSYNHIHYKKSGEKQYVDVSTSPIYDRYGNISQVVHIARDITERKKTEQELENVFNLSPEMIGVFNTNGTFIKINPAWEKVLGYTTNELLELGWAALIHPDDMEPTNKTVEEQLKGSPVANFINRYRHKDGTYKTLEWQATPAEGEIVHATARDITERVKMEEQLKHLAAESLRLRS